MKRPKCPRCGNFIKKVKFGYTTKWVCINCHAEYGYGTKEPIL
jgi:transposase-like protein